MKFVRLGFLAALLLLWQQTGVALSDEHFSTIKRLGELNGVALHCKSLEETQRMKRALVLNLPKRRQLGDLFDHETHLSFMHFIQEGATCPSPALLRKQVDDAILVLEEVFKKP